MPFAMFNEGRRGFKVEQAIQTWKVKCPQNILQFCTKTLIRKMTNLDVTIKAKIVFAVNASFWEIKDVHTKTRRTDYLNYNG